MSLCKTSFLSGEPRVYVSLNEASKKWKSKNNILCIESKTRKAQIIISVEVVLEFKCF